MDEGFLEHDLRLDTVGDIDPDDRVDRDSLEEVLSSSEEVVFDDLCDHGNLP